MLRRRGESGPGAKKSLRQEKYKNWGRELGNAKNPTEGEVAPVKILGGKKESVERVGAFHNVRRGKGRFN